MPHQDLRSDLSLGQLFSKLSNEFGTLVRQEVRLAKAELSEKGTQVGQEVAVLVAGGLVVYAGFLVFLAALILILAEVMAAWLAALLVALVVIGAGYLLVQQGLAGLKQMDPLPRKTAETLKENTEWMKQQLN